MALSIVLILSLLSAVLCSWSSFQSLDWLWVLPLSFVGSFLGMLVLVLLTMCILALTVNLKKPQEHDNKLFRRVIHFVVDLLIPLLGVHLHTKGLEQTPKSGRIMLVCNHLHEVDPAVLIHCFPKSQLAFIGKQETLQMPLVREFMHRIMCQLVNRENDREALKTILNCIGLLKEDKVSIGVFPEGYCSLDYKLHPFRHGVFKIAQKANVPIVVCTLQNTHKVLSNFRRLKPTHIHMHLVGVLYPEDIQGMTTVEVGTKVHAMMAQDLGPELVLQEAE